MLRATRTQYMFIKMLKERIGGNVFYLLKLSLLFLKQFYNMVIIKIYIFISNNIYYLYWVIVLNVSKLLNVFPQKKKKKMKYGLHEKINKN